MFDFETNWPSRTLCKKLGIAVARPAQDLDWEDAEEILAPVVTYIEELLEGQREKAFAIYDDGLGMCIEDETGEVLIGGPIIDLFDVARAQIDAAFIPDSQAHLAERREIVGYLQSVIVRLLQYEPRKGEKA